MFIDDVSSTSLGLSNAIALNSINHPVFPALTFPARGWGPTPTAARLLLGLVCAAAVIAAIAAVIAAITAAAVGYTLGPGHLHETQLDLWRGTRERDQFHTILAESNMTKSTKQMHARRH